MGCQDIPLALNVEFVSHAPNQVCSHSRMLTYADVCRRMLTSSSCPVSHAPNQSANAVLGSKASAEPVMALGAAVLFAAIHAIAAVRAQAGCPCPDAFLQGAFCPVYLLC